MLDIRYPVTADGEEIFERLRAAAGAYGVKARVLAEQKPLFVPEDTPLIRMLKGAYETVTGGRARLYGTGGGTYARSLQNRGVAFGPVFPGEENHLHDADEFIEIEKFMLHAQICLEALFRMQRRNKKSPFPPSRAKKGKRAFFAPFSPRIWQNGAFSGAVINSAVK